MSLSKLLEFLFSIYISVVQAAKFKNGVLENQTIFIFILFYKNHCKITIM